MEVRIELFCFLNFGIRWGWVASAMPRPLYCWKGPSTHHTGGWVGPMAGVGGCGKSRPITGIRSLDHPAHNKSLYWLSCPSVCVCVLTKFVYKVRAVSQWQFVPYFQNMLLILTLSSRFTDDSSSYWFKTYHIFINKAMDYVKCFLLKKKPCANMHDDMQRSLRLA